MLSLNLESGGAADPLLWLDEYSSVNVEYGKPNAKKRDVRQVFAISL